LLIAAATRKKPSTKISGPIEGRGNTERERRKIGVFGKK
jgi:hypothetical protein